MVKFVRVLRLSRRKFLGMELFDVGRADGRGRLPTASRERGCLVV